MEKLIGAVGLMIMGIMCRHNIGIGWNGEIYTLKGKIQLKEAYLGVVIIMRYPEEYNIYTISGKKGIKLKYCEPGYRIKYQPKHRIEYEYGVPFKLTDGTIVYQKKIKKGFGYIYVDQQEATEWPLEITAICENGLIE